MKAIIIKEPGAPDVLAVREVDEPEVGPKEVLIRVRAAGVNRPDVMQRQGKYPPPPDAPQNIPGLEVAGEIHELGSEVKGWKKGEEISTLVPGGGYAEYVAADAGLCLPIPKGFSFVEAAGLPETVLTVWHNVFQRGQLKSGETLLVHGGTSGIGITAIQLAKAMGSRVFATAGTIEKCNACEELGADKCINYKESDFEKEFSDGVDVILDMVGGPYFEKNINILNPDGRLVYINAMQGSKVTLNILKMMVQRITVTGSTLRSREISFKRDLTSEVRKNVWPLILAGKFKPIVYKTFPLEEADKAHELMESSKHIGKIILTI